MDPGRLVQCPYDKNHQIKASRLPYHLVKCKKNNQKIAKKIATCPYNARHRIPTQKLSLHTETCESKFSSEENSAAKITQNPAPKVKEVATQEYPSFEEDWEADTDEFPARPFIFGEREDQ